MTAARIVAAYRVTFVACLVALSGLALVHGHEAHPHVAPLATTEIGAALLLLARRTQRIGLAGLLLVFALAAAVTVATTRMPPIALLLYAASATAIVALDERMRA